MITWRQIGAICAVIVGSIWTVGLFLHQVIGDRLDDHHQRMDRIAAATQKADAEALTRIERMETLVLERALQLIVRTEVEEQLPEVVEDIIDDEGVDP